LVEVIRNFHRDHPDTTNLDIRQAIRLALREVGTGGQAGLIAVFLGIVFLGLLAALYFGRQWQFENPTAVISVIIILCIIVIGMALIRRNR
jgi:hypothetical protein